MLKAESAERGETLSSASPDEKVVPSDDDDDEEDPVEEEVDTTLELDPPDDVLVLELDPPEPEALELPSVPTVQLIARFLQALALHQLDDIVQDAEY